MKNDDYEIPVLGSLTCLCADRIHVENVYELAGIMLMVKHLPRVASDLLLQVDLSRHILSSGVRRHPMSFNEEEIEVIRDTTMKVLALFRRQYPKTLNNAILLASDELTKNGVLLC